MDLLKLDETHRNAVISAYGRILGNRLDDLIMLRANLWVQMDQVGDFIQALNQGDNARIMQFKAQVDRLAHQLGTTMHRRRDGVSEGGTGKPPSTVTVNTLLREDQQRRDVPPPPPRQPSGSIRSTRPPTATRQTSMRYAPSRTTARIRIRSTQSALSTPTTPRPASMRLLLRQARPW